MEGIRGLSAGNVGEVTAQLRPYPPAHREVAAQLQTLVSIRRILAAMGAIFA